MCNEFLDYCHVQFPDVGPRLYKCNMILNIYFVALYLVAPYAPSRTVVFYQLSSNTHPKSSIVASVLVQCKTLRHVVTSSAECETAGVFYNAQ